MKLGSWKKTPWLSWGIPIIGIVATGLLEWLALEKTDFHWAYPLDDTYIHLAIAKNIVLHGNWGLSPHQFQFSSSSPGFTVLLAFITLFVGVKIWSPLLINGLLSIGFWVWGRNRFQRKKDWMAAGIFLLGPVPLLVLQGMEHLLHSFLVAVWCWRAVKELSENQAFSWQALLLAALSISVRYESLFLLAALASLALLHKKWKDAAILLCVGTLPVLLIGAASLTQGGTFLPLPIWMKGHAPGMALAAWIQWGVAGLNRLYENPFMLMLGLGLLYVGRKSFLKQGKASFLFLLSLLNFFAVLAHVFFAEVGGYRYEAYLILLGLMVLAKGAEEYSWEEWKTWPMLPKWMFRFGIGLFLFPFLIRVGFFSVNYPLATQNIYQQQVMMGKFLHTYYPQASVAANDVGAVSYFTEIQLTDLLGIADQEVAEFRKENQYSSKNVEELSKERGIQLAVVHKEWVGDYLPASWAPVASWTIPDNFICAFDQVSWYAVAENPDTLLQHLQAFEATLPEGIRVEYHQ